ncbi:MAG: TatD family hydrolase [Candidatus Cloacimonetes bacterium]|nr:TatD family hydrolase [Candidatus Cloacimonadota bacterium]
MNIVDAHLHLANLAAELEVEPLLEDCAGKGIDHFFSIALMKSEVEWHKQHPRSNVDWCTGIHPNFEDCDLEPGDIQSLLASGTIKAIGEIGLDRNNPDIEGQIQVFSAQLALAAEYQVPVVIHLVGHQHKAYELLRTFPLHYLIHGYAGSLEGFEALNRLSCLWTISSRILKPDKTFLLDAMLSCGNFLFESDYTRYYLPQPRSPENPLLKPLRILEDASQRNIHSREELIAIQKQNYLALWA